MATDMQRLYDEDFYAWTQAQARELRRFAEARPNLPLDLPHLAEEIRDLGKEQRNAVRSLVRQVLIHLIRLQHSPADEPRNAWADEIDAARDDLHDRLTATLRRDLGRQLPKLYAEAQRRAARKMARYGETAELPEQCPYPLAGVLDRDWFPERHVRGEPSR